MKQLFLILVLTLITNSSFASFNPEVVTAKVKSKLCEEKTDATDLYGSGIVFHNNSKFYVLTSEHVVYHDSNEFCHQIYAPYFGDNWVNTKLIVADYGYGLALLLIDHEQAKRAPQVFPSISSFKSPDERTRKVTIAGFPYQSTETIIDYTGEILATNSIRIRIPLISSLLEIDGFSQYGMSGGGILSGYDDTIFALISHKLLKEIPGGMESADNNSIEIDSRLVFAIPGDVINHWLNKVFSETEYNPIFQRVAEMQLDNLEVIRAGNIKFELQTDTELLASLEFKKAEKGSTIALGGDGVGIGGTKREDYNRSIKIEIAEPDDRFKLDSSSEHQHLVEFIKSYESKLYTKRSIEIPFLKNEESLMQIKSLPWFLAAIIENESITPITFSKVDSTELNSIEKELFEAGNSIHETLQVISSALESVDSDKRRTSPQNTNKNHASILLNKLQILATNLRSDQSLLVTIEEISILENHRGWQYFFELTGKPKTNLTFNMIVNLKSTLIKCKETLKRKSG